MNKLLLAGLLVATPLALRAPHAVAAPRSESPALPAQVRALLPKGAVSFWGERMNIGYGGSKMFVHVWGIPRRMSAADRAESSYGDHYDSPVCVDVFAPQLNARKKWGWKLMSSASFTESKAPTEVTSHWLQPDKKQGVILDIITAYGIPGASTSHQLLVWPNFQGGTSATAPLQLWTGGSGGGGFAIDWRGSDSKGFTNFGYIDYFGDKTNSSTPYTWNGRMFVAGPAVKPPKM